MENKKTLQDLRKEKGMSQTFLAKKVDISRQYLTDLEKGYAIPTLLIAKRMAEALGLSLEELSEHFEEGA